ncbi:lantibiotic dehydratase [Streptomyces europaeiscabiei]|uniref:lantibiotic dehydratase n=1 Tax=Streptomyces europaeiscabiei TaxID=146819 RepID=UPI002E17317A
MLIRTPLLPVETYLSLSQPTAFGHGTDDDDNPHATGLDRRHLCDPRVRSALAVGSLDLFEALERAEADLADPAAIRGKLLRYLIRMSTRPTPFGLFAGVALARWGPHTDLALAASTPKTLTRPDMEWLLHLVFTLEGHPEIRRRVNLYANPQAFVRAGRVFLPEVAPGGHANASGGPISLRATQAVRHLLTVTRTPLPYDQIVSELLPIPGASRERAEELITSLWEQTVLLTDLRPPLTVACPAEYVARRLDTLPTAAKARALLDKLLSAMATWDTLPTAQRPRAYRELLTLTRSAEGVPATPTPAQVDMALSLDGCRLNATVAQEAAEAAELLLRLTPLPKGPASIDAYRRAFEHRYGPGCEVGLLELLSPDFGLGPPSAWHQNGLAPGMDPARFATRQRSLRDLAIKALRERRLAVQLDDDTLEQLDSRSAEPTALPASLDISLFLIAASASAIDTGEFRLVLGPNLGAQAAGRNLGRFAELLGPQADALLRHAAQTDRAHAPNALWVEVSYLPYRLRAANVIIRPLVRDGEIPIGTTGEDPSRNTVPLNELVVGIREGRFYLRWPARKTDVIPCAGHMLNTAQAPAVCRFLEELRHDGVAHLSDFDWGPAADLPFLPRVERGRLVLSPARWRLGADLPSASATTFERALRNWRAAWKVPRYVYLTAADNRLLLDLEDAAQADELRVELRRLPPGNQLLLQEALPAPDQAWTPGPDGHYMLELVVPLSLRPGTTRRGAPAAAPAPRPLADTSTRVRPPGSEWLFAKLYCPPAFEEDLITGPMSAFCEYTNTSGAAHEWFFVRYSDPDRHLRVRWRGDPDRLVGELLPQLCAWAQELITAGMCSRLCLDTYEREISRYGGPGSTAAAETLFASDSRTAVELLRLSREARSEVDPTVLAILNIDDLLAGLGLSQSDRLAWYRDRVTSTHESGPEYRQRKAVLRRLLADPALYIRAGAATAASALDARRRQLTTVRARLDALQQTGELALPLTQLCASYVHLSCNRLLGPGWPSEEQTLGLLLRTQTALAHAPIRPGEAVP